MTLKKLIEDLEVSEEEWKEYKRELEEINNLFKSFISIMSRKDKLTIIKCINIKSRTKSFRIRKKQDSRIRGIIRKYIGVI